MLTVSDEEMQGRSAEFCTYRDLTALVMTWNAGASKPGDLTNDDKSAKFFEEFLKEGKNPDIISFGLQELVDLEDKKLTASMLV